MRPHDETPPAEPIVRKPGRPLGTKKKPGWKKTGPKPFHIKQQFVAKDRIPSEEDGGPRRGNRVRIPKYPAANALNTGATSSTLSRSFSAPKTAKRNTVTNLATKANVPKRQKIKISSSKKQVSVEKDSKAAEEAPVNEPKKETPEVGAEEAGHPRRLLARNLTPEQRQSVVDFLTENRNNYSAAGRHFSELWKVVMTDYTVKVVSISEPEQPDQINSTTNDGSTAESDHVDERANTTI